MVTQINEREKGDTREVARVMHKLSQAYERNGDANRGAVMAKEANNIHVDLFSTGKYTHAEQEPEKWDYLVCLKF